MPHETRSSPVGRLEAFLGLFVVWELLALLLDSRSLPRFSSVAGWIIEDLRLLSVSAFATAVRALFGLLLAAITGITLGTAMAMSTRIDHWLSPGVNFLRPLPSSALILLFAIWFGLDWMPLLVTWFGSTWPILISTRDRGDRIKSEVKDTLKVLGMGWWRKFRTVYSRALLPGMLSGVRVAVSIALILTVTVELVVQPSSFLGLTSEWSRMAGDRNIPWALGSYMSFYYEKGAVLQILSAVLVAGLTGALLNQVYHWMASWVESSQMLSEGR